MTAQEVFSAVDAYAPRFRDSIDICKGITGDTQFGNGMSIRYVLVTSTVSI